MEARGFGKAAMPRATQAAPGPARPRRPEALPGDSTSAWGAAQSREVKYSLSIPQGARRRHLVARARSSEE